MSKYFLPILILVVSIALAMTSAYFSVTGLSKLFAGAATAVIIMASILELAKIVTTAWLHNNWNKKINKLIKFWLVFAVSILAILTSLGVYSFLANSYFITSTKLSKVSTEINLLEKDKLIYDKKILNYEKIKSTKNDRIEALTTLRIQQENRIDSLIKKGMNSAVKRTEIQIKDANVEISKLMNDNNKMDSLIQVENSKISDIEFKKVTLNDNDAEAEVGPLKYIAKLTNSSMDSIINWFILMIILVFDPLAIILLIAANISLEKIKEEKIVETKKNNKIEQEIIQEVEQNEISETKDELPATEEKEESSIQLPTKIQSFFEEKVESEIEFKKKIEELNKQKNKEEDIKEIVSEEQVEISQEPIVVEPKSINTFNIYQSVSQEEVITPDEIFMEEPAIEESVVEPEIIVEQPSQPEVKFQTIQGVTYPIKEEKLVEDTLYLKLLSVLFKNGTVNLNDEIPSYQEFANDLKIAEIKCNETFIRDFLSACNLVKVIDTDKNKKIATKSYQEARDIIGKI